MAKGTLEEWMQDIRNLDIDILGNEVLVELYYTETAKSPLTTLEGDLLSDKYGKEVYNLAKIIEVGSDVKQPLEKGMIVSVPDEMFEPIPDGSAGFNPNSGQPNAGYIALGKLIPFSYLKDKVKEPKNDLLFLIPSSWIKVIHKNVLVQQKV